MGSPVAVGGAAAAAKVLKRRIMEAEATRPDSPNKKKKRTRIIRDYHRVTNHSSLFCSTTLLKMPPKL